VGKADLIAKRGNEKIASLTVSVVAPLALLDPTTDAGLYVRLFLAEARNPGQSGFSKADSKTAMQRMKLVVENRLAKKPAQFGAPGAKTVFDIVKAPGQFNGFQQYPVLADGQQQTIEEVLRVANDDSDTRQAAFTAFVEEAKAVATGPTITDPSAKGLVAWRTAGSGSPGPSFVSFGTSVSGNQFYTLK
jgi:hypothetical protein